MSIERINGGKKKEGREKRESQEEERQITNPWGGREGEKTLSRTRGSGWGCSAVAPPRQEAAEKRGVCGEGVLRVSGGGRKKEKARRRGREMERGRGEKEGGGRPGIDRLKKGWIFLPLGGGPAALEGRVPDSITTKPTSDLRNRSTEDLLSLFFPSFLGGFFLHSLSSFSFLFLSPSFRGAISAEFGDDRTRNSRWNRCYILQITKR